MKLYEISEQYREILDSYADMVNQGETAEEEAEIEQAWRDMLDGMEQAFADKAEAIAVYCKELEGDISTLKAEQDNIKKRISSKQRTIDNMKSYIMDNMLNTNISKIDTAKCNIKLNRSKTTDVYDTAAFVKWAQANEHDEMLTYAEPTPKKAIIKAWINAGNTVDGVRISNNTSISIK